MKDKKIYCTECGEEIEDEYYYIGENHIALLIDENVFCSWECILDFLMVDSNFIDEGH